MGINDIAKMGNLKSGNIRPDLVSPKNINNIYEIKSPKDINNTDDAKKFYSNVIQSNSIKNKKATFQFK